MFNAPYSNTRSVVELAIAEIISLARRLHEKSTDMHAGIWNKSAAGSHEVRGRTLGIVGYGNIGSQLSVIAEALGFKVIFYDIDDKLALGNARRCSTMEELLTDADVVSLHVDGRPGNAGLFGDEQMSLMKPRSLFLNLSRGIAVDPVALRAHIESGHIAGAAVDVFPVEPKRQGDPFESELRGLRNVILTPHVGGSTEEAQQDIGRFVASKLRAYVGVRRHLAERQHARDQPARRHHAAPPRARPPERTRACWPRSTACWATTASTSTPSRSPRAARSATSSPTSPTRSATTCSPSWRSCPRRCGCASSAEAVLNGGYSSVSR